MDDAQMIWTSVRQLVITHSSRVELSPELLVHLFFQDKPQSFMCPGSIRLIDIYSAAVNCPTLGQWPSFAKTDSGQYGVRLPPSLKSRHSIIPGDRSSGDEPRRIRFLCPLRSERQGRDGISKRYIRQLFMWSMVRSISSWRGLIWLKRRLSDRIVETFSSQWK